MSTKDTNAKHTNSENTLPSASLQPELVNKYIAHNYSEITRRSFLRYAGIGVGAVLLASPTCAFATDDTEAEEPLDALEQQSGAADRITGTFKYGGAPDTSKFIFDPAFFKDSSFTFSNQLATFACCLSLAAYGANDDISKYEESPKYAKEFYNKLNFNDVTCNDYYTKQTEHHSIGVICGHRTITVDNQNYELVMMGIRGANYFFEWCGNLAAGKENDHQGFTTAANKSLDFLKNYVSEKVPTDNPLKILISGFSRSSAVANMVGGLLVRTAHNEKLPCGAEQNAGDNSKGFYFGGKPFPNTNLKFPFPKHEVYQKDLYVYGYEVPSGACNSASADKELLDSWSRSYKMNPFGNAHSIVNPCDLIPKVMPVQWSFGRFGVDHLLPRPSDSNYKSARDAMLTFAKAINANFPSRYPVDSFDHMDMTMDAFFNTMIDKLVHDLTGSRPTYNRDYETPLVDLMDYMVAGKIYKIQKVSSKSLFKAWIWSDIISEALGDLLVPGLGLLDLIRLAFKYFTDSLITDLLDTIVTKLRVLGLEWGDDEKKLYNELRRICPMIQKFARHNLSLSVAIAKTFMSDANTMQVHSGTLCLAWMQSNDSNYNSSNSTNALLEAGSAAALGNELAAQEGEGTGEGTGTGTGTGEGEGAGEDTGMGAGTGADTDAGQTLLLSDRSYKKILFDGNITVSLAADSTYMKLFENGQCVENANVPYCYGLNEDFQMFIIVPYGTDLMFKIESDKNDLFTITSVSCKVAGEAPAKILSYNAIGDGYETIFATVSSSGIAVSTSDITIDEYNYAVEVDNLDGTQETHCNVVLESANEEEGWVLGGGYNVYGTSSQLIAYPNTGYEFDYWSVNGTRDTNPVQFTTVSAQDNSQAKAASYLFYVNNDYGESVDVVAHFKAAGEGAGEDAGEGSGDKSAAQAGASAYSMAQTGDSVGACALSATAIAGAAAVGVAGIAAAQSANEEK